MEHKPTAAFFWAPIAAFSPPPHWPLEGPYNDVPISSIARAIEIDLREMIGDTDIPPALKAQHGFLM